MSLRTRTSSHREKSMPSPLDRAAERRARLGRFIADARKAAGLTQTELADLIRNRTEFKTRQSAVSQWEIGNAAPSPEIWHDIEDILGVDEGSMHVVAYGRNVMTEGFGMPITLLASWAQLSEEQRGELEPTLKAIMDEHIRRKRSTGN